MKVSFHLIVNEKGTVKTAKNKPSLSWDEVAVFVTLDLPNALFRKPQLSAQITIPESAAAPSDISADVVQNVKEAIEQASGLEVRLTLVNPEQP